MKPTDESSTSWPDSREALTAHLQDVLARDASELERLWHAAVRRQRKGLPFDRLQQAWLKRWQEARENQRKRLLHWPTAIGFPSDLPISERLQDIADALERHQVVVVAGETGSGKTTQLPKLCLQLGRGKRGMIGHTQPRRIAARSVAERLVEELGGKNAEPWVGYRIRFDETVGDDGVIQVMTDGILLTELRQDPELLKYDTIIVDEAHERSLNIDFILGYLKRLLPRRPDLKLIITSATIDVERFSAHFDNAPVIEVSGRTYPVEVRYRPLVDDDEDEQREPVEGILEAVKELQKEGPGDVLVFLPGEREIRDAAGFLRNRLGDRWEILPLYSRLSRGEQERIFKSHRLPRVVLATNVAETSLTVPGIRYVVDTGLARISRYSVRNKVQRLPIEPISQASANQRKGRCGRLQDGICIRLYSEEDFARRPAFTDPEIRRVHLASVILKLLDLGLGDIEAFPFLEPPDERQIADGFRLLQTLGAIDQKKRLTERGRRMARLPLDPVLAAIVEASGRFGCLREALVICSALSVVDPRERPAEQAQKAAASHLRFVTQPSDFVSWVNLWNYLHEQRESLSSSQFRKRLKQEFLSFLRVRDWFEVYRQILRLCKGLGYRLNTSPADYRNLHQALLVGFPDRIGQKSPEGDYLGARGIRFRIGRQSAIHAKLPEEVRRAPRWVVAAELVETQHLYASNVAVIEPEWVLEAVPHLVKTHYFEPFWSKRHGRLMAERQRTLFGLMLEGRKPVPYHKHEPELSRRLLIERGLMEREINTRNPLIQASWKAIDQVRKEEDEVRSRDRLVDDESLFQLWDARVPEFVTSLGELERWLKQLDDSQRKQWVLQVDEVRRSEQPEDTGMPKHWELNGMRLPLSYRFEPGHEEDGVTVTLPVQLVGQVREKDFQWLVPAFRQEKIAAYIRGLPKRLRKHFVPAPDFARAALERMPQQGVLEQELADALTAMTGVKLTAQDLADVDLPPHLCMVFKVVDEEGKVLFHGRNLDGWAERLDGKRESSVDLPQPQKPLASTWPDAWTVPQQRITRLMGIEVDSWQALAIGEPDEPSRPWKGKGVTVRDSADEAASRYEHRRAVTWLLWHHLKDLLAWVEKQDRLKRTLGPLVASRWRWRDVVAAGGWRLCGQALLKQVPDGQWASREDMHQVLTVLRASLAEDLVAWLEAQAIWLQQLPPLDKALKGQLPVAGLGSYGDIRRTLDRWCGQGCWLSASEHRLRHMPRYIKSLVLRMDRLPHSALRERGALSALHNWEDAVDALVQRVKPREKAWPQVIQLMDGVDELRISMLTQELGTAFPVSEKRLRKQWLACGLGDAPA
jgi:ATP-dependent helicase HrpA